MTSTLAAGTRRYFTMSSFDAFETVSTRRERFAAIVMNVFA